jgi:arylsulfatase A-like enzyme
LSVSRQRWLKALVVSTLAMAACVTPTPPPGAPIPSLALTASATDPVAGIVHFTATPSNFEPIDVTFRLDRLDGAPLAVDTNEPFTVTVDTATLGRGKHTLFAIGRDSTYTVFNAKPFTTRVNIVVVLVDDMDAMTMPLWDALPRTRQAFGNRGTTFTNAFAPDPVCCPARATLLTGKYPHNTGVLNHTPPNGGYPVFAANGSEQDTVATRLQDAGYRTAFAGKYLNGYELDPSKVPPGWDEWFGLAGSIYGGYGYEANHNGVLKAYGSQPSDFQTDVLAAQATDFIRSTEAQDEQPFLLFVAPSAPHFNNPPAPRHTNNAFADDPLPRHPDFNELDVSDKPEWLRTGVPLLDANGIDGQEREYRRMMGSLLAVDDLVAATTQTLRENNELDSTMFVFTSDNGYFFGGHRLTLKIAPYEEATRVPLVIAGPGIPQGAEPALVTQLDVMPTLLDYANVAVPDTTDGRSLRPLLEHTASDWRHDFLLEFDGRYAVFYYLHTREDVRRVVAAGARMLVPTYRALRTDRYLYVEWYAGEDHDYELYDLTNDPWQMWNLVATPAGAAEHSALTTALQNRMEALAACGGASCRSG